MMRGCGKLIWMYHTMSGIATPIMRMTSANFGASFRVMNATMRQIRLISPAIPYSIKGILSISVCIPGLIDAELELVPGFVNSR